MFSLLLTCAPEHPGNLEGKVVSIADGDTITVLVDRTQVKSDSAPSTLLRGDRTSLNGADSASGLVFGKAVEVVTDGKDRYGR